MLIQKYHISILSFSIIPHIVSEWKEADALN